MTKVKTLADLRKLKAEMQGGMDLREAGENPENLVKVRVAMATCGIAAGAKDTMNYFMETLKKRGIKAIVTQTGCMGYCYAEPTVEVTLPGKSPLVYGHVDATKADEIIEVYIKNGKLVDGIIPETFSNPNA